jgi:putative tryptophan/tyrosine transport system substrate-binding protein
VNHQAPSVARRFFSRLLDQTQLKAGESVARKAGIETLRLGIDQPSDFRGAFQRAVDAKMDALLVHSSPIFVDQAAAIAELAREFRLPSIGLFPIYAKVGGFISYGPNNFELLKQAGGIVGKILRGAKPAEFPIQRPIYLSFLINMHTAKLLRLTIPPSVSALADEVVDATLLQTAKMNDVDPHAWLTQTLERIAQGWPISQIDQLMPWNFKA